MHITSGDYEIRFDPQQPHILQVIDTKSENVMHLTLQEAVDLLILMYKHRDDLYALRTGK